MKHISGICQIKVSTSKFLSLASTSKFLSLVNFLATFSSYLGIISSISNIYSEQLINSEQIANLGNEQITVPIITTSEHDQIIKSNLVFLIPDHQEP